jgi:hypothetical protein
MASKTRPRAASPEPAQETGAIHEVGRARHVGRKDIADAPEGGADRHAGVEPVLHVMGIERHMADERRADPTIGGLAQRLGPGQFGHGVGGERLDPDGGGDVMPGEGAVVVGGGESCGGSARPSSHGWLPG